MRVALVRKLFSSASYVLLDKSNYKLIISASSECKKALKREHLGRYFLSNREYLIPACVAPFIISTPFFLFYNPASERNDMYVGIDICLLLLYFLVLPVFQRVLKAPTWEGREILDQLKGFAMYLGTGEGERLKGFHHPELARTLREAAALCIRTIPRSAVV